MTEQSKPQTGQPHPQTDEQVRAQRESEDSQPEPQQAQQAPQDGRRDDRGDLERRIADLELALAQSNAAAPLGTIPEHAAGPGLDIADTWGMYDQGLARVGEHPLQQDDRENDE